jgi:hypothetical protein
MCSTTLTTSTFDASGPIPRGGSKDRSTLTSWLCEMVPSTSQIWLHIFSRILICSGLNAHLSSLCRTSKFWMIQAIMRLSSRKQTTTMKDTKYRLTTVIGCPQSPACWLHSGGCTVRSASNGAQESPVLTRTKVSIAEPKFSKLVWPVRNSLHKTSFYLSACSP